jgi:ribulose-phosphate 3-epimerase
MAIILSASILSANFAALGEQISAAQTGGVDWIHVDVMDGAFVPQITMGPFIVETCHAATDLPIDVHLMVEKPERHLEAFAQAGAAHLTVHVETCPHLYHTLQIIRSLGCRPGVALNPGTPASSLSEVLHLVDLVLVMTVNPGASGQRFIPETVTKILTISKMLTKINSQARIEVDGGTSSETLPLTYGAGARVFVAATSIFKYPGGIAAGITALRQAVKG